MRVGTHLPLSRIPPVRTSPLCSQWVVGRGAPFKGRTLNTSGADLPVRRRVVVRGFVQGVFFRDTVRRRAETRGVAGWVRNNRDGTVEAVFEGEPEAVERLVAFVHEGPSGARVDRVDVHAEEPEGLTGFAIR
jgi:acylphosphatase